MKPTDIINPDQFFAPTQSSALDLLLSGYQADKTKAEGFLSALTDEYRGILHHFERSGRTSIPKLDIDTAVISLNAYYWSRAFDLTDIAKILPTDRKNKWDKQLTAWRNEYYQRGKNPEEDLPDFEEETVKATFRDLFAMRETYFAERVDGIFRALSKSHVTNQPEGFSKRMIINGIMTQWGTTDSTRTGYIRDLRSIIARFMGRDEPHYNSTDFVIKESQKVRGQWVSMDGGALRIRTYLVGTAHLEVHPEMAWRLNAVLASLYPAAIPEKNRKTIKVKKHKDFELMQRPLPFSVLELLQTGNYWDKSNYRRQGHDNRVYEKTINSFEFYYTAKDKRFALDEAYSVLEAIGGVKSGDAVIFDYNARDVINQIITSGCIPDFKSFQYYPTPPELAQKAVELAEITDSDTCLEPSAGTGGLADYMPKDRTTCVEVSELHCDVLRSKGYKVALEDFLAYHARNKFNRIVMNPPFADGRAKAHVEHALTMLAPKGRLVAILPSSFIGKSLSDKGVESWTPAIDNAFKNASVSVTIYKFEAD